MAASSATGSVFRTAGGGNEPVIFDRRRVLLTREGIAVASVFEDVDSFAVEE